eukprot:CAMPEP_0172195768 /NCGR_PEP_ID=MMETSP1050-20130122/26407_1 /TAXON_ID=233186 /ORGANISM="Cryptomonas curvata, Strain CCAP979/52" /LENGTH=203 /DNA_ID=CAMNT_0012871899 /DNA_START=1 /DNA_END=609 /DNA_ORIENTATION=-
MNEARALLEKSREHEMAVLEISTAQYAPVLSTESVHLTGSDVAQTSGREFNFAAEPSLGTGDDVNQQELDEEVSPATVESFRRGSQGSRNNSAKDHVVPVDEENVLRTSHTLRSPKTSITHHSPPVSPSLNPSHPKFEKSPHIQPMRALEWSARVIGLNDPERGESSGDEDEVSGWNGAGHAVAGTATLEEHLLMRALEKDFA